MIQLKHRTYSYELLKVESRTEHVALIQTNPPWIQFQYQMSR